MRTRSTRGVTFVLVILLLAGAAVSATAAQDRETVQTLRSLVPAELKGTCERLRPRDMAISVRDAVAALVCTPRGPVEDVGLYLFDDVDQLEGWWLERLAMIEQRLGPGDCEQGAAGIEPRLNGQLVCYRDRGVARIRWIDTERLLYGSLDMTKRAIAPAYAWWTETIASCCGPAQRPSDPEAGPHVTWRRQDQAQGWPVSLEVDLSTPSLAAVAEAPDGTAVLLGSTYVREPLAWYASEGMDWTKADLAGLLKGCRDCTPGPSRKVAQPRDVAAWGGGFIAVGDADTDGRHDGAVWMSDEGVSWTRPVRLDGVSLRRLVVTDTALAVVGVADRKREDGRGIPTLWTSADGQTWTAHPISERPAWVGSAARSPDGLWIVRGTGAWRSEGDGRLWRSVDGLTWDELTPPSQDSSGNLLKLVGPAWTPTGFVLGANKVDRDGNHAGSELWHSPDGLTWTVVAGSEGAFGSLVGGHEVSVALPSVLGTDVGFIDVPESSRESAVVLTSADGRSWCQAASDSYAGSSVISGDTDAHGGVLAAGNGGRYGGLPRTWRGEPTIVGSVPCTAAQVPTDDATFTLEPVIAREPHTLKMVAELEAAPRRAIEFERLMADLEPLLHDPSTQAVALDRYWFDLAGDAEFCRRTDGEERLFTCSSFLEVAVDIYHYAPSDHSWRFVRDAYDFIFDGLATARERRFLRDDVHSYFDIAIDEYAAVTGPSDPGDM